MAPVGKEVSANRWLRLRSELSAQVDDGKTGYLVPRDIAALADAIVDHARPNLRRQFGANGKAKITITKSDIAPNHTLAVIAQL